MEMDDDGNGIPDEFESEFLLLKDKIVAMDADALNIGDIREGKAYKTLRAFYERLPIKAETKELLDEIAGAFEEFALADSPEDRDKAMKEVAEKEERAAETDKVYADAVRYIKAILGDGAGDDRARSRSDAGQTLPAQIYDYEAVIRQEGDIIYRDSQPTADFKESFPHACAMHWTHTGVYSGNGQAYDSDTKAGQYCTTVKNSGVALRSLDRYFREGFYIKFSELKTASGQASEDDALAAAESSTERPVRPRFPCTPTNTAKTSSTAPS